MSEFNLEDLAAKIEWEGGFEGALDYGIKPEDVPEEIRPLWQRAVDAHRELEKVWDELEKVLPCQE